MDVVNNVRECLKSWTKGGESECRKILLTPHSNPADPVCLDVLTTAYHTLLCATLTTWTPTNPLTPTAFVEFVNSILSSLPSSSTTSSKGTSNATIFGDHLVDMIWSVDTELDELLIEARAATAATATGEPGKPPSREAVMLSTKTKKALSNVENDKQRIPVILRRLLDYQIISPDHCRERLETAVLASVGLIQDKAVHDRKEIRTKTALFYKQNKFNLLREQSEGYSKLIVELTSNLGPAHSSQNGRPTEPYAAVEDRARPVWEKVISLIGYFDLDPNRALDVILDVLSQHLLTHYSFFVALLSFSPWAGSYRRPLPESEIMDTRTEVPVGAFKGKTLDEALDLVEANSLSGTIPNSVKGAEAQVLPQVLGFKFSYYQSPDVSETVPRSLYLTAAILIREGFIALEDLYPHLSPSDEDMLKCKQEYDADVQSRIAGAKNSMLAMAAPLESSGPPSSRSKAPSTPAPEVKKVEPKDTNQKAGLLATLLAVGSLKPAIAILSKFPWLVDARPEIADLMIRVLKVSVSPLYESLFVTKERNPSFTHPKARYGPSGVTYPPARKPLLTHWAPTPPSTNTTDFVFFFPDWVDRIPIATNLEDLEDLIEPLLRFIGLYVSRDPLFLTKFLRLGRYHLQTTVPIDPVTKKVMGEPDPEHPIRHFWFMILRRYLLPALPLIRGNAVCTVEVWNIIRQYETTARWRLYGEWKDHSYKSHPELRIRAVQADRESKGILRRLSLNTIDSLSGPVAKLAHSNPCILFTNAVNQIMAYDNLANVVIQALRYVTNMGFDVLVFIVIGAFANPDKERVKDDGVNASDWLQSLASFTGMLFRRYSADLTPVLKYIVHQLHNGQSTEIIVLRELIWKMAGIEPLPSLSESQMAAMAGGPSLRIEAIASEARGARLDPGDAMKGPQRLGKGLLESSLALPLLIQVAQQRQACVYKAPNTHLKSLAGLYDATHGVLLQYLELLTSPSVISEEDYATKILPTITELGRDYGICAPICMQIMRPVLHASLLKAALAMQEQERINSEEAEKRLKAALAAKRDSSSAKSRVASPAVGVSDLPEAAKPDIKAEEVGAPMEVDSGALTTPLKEESPWLPELAALFDDIKNIAPGDAYNVIGPGFYATFWQLSTYDLSPPGPKYDEEVAKLRVLSRQEDSKYVAADRSSDRAKRLTSGSHRIKRDRYTSFVNILAQEFKEQTVSRAFTIKRLAKEKLHWFAHSKSSIVLNNSLVEHCVQPRCLLSPMDADFCVQFVKLLHAQGTPGFYTIGFYQKILGDHIKVVLFSCSEYEARNYGRFLKGIIQDLLRWHLDENAFEQDSQTKSGGETVYLPGFLTNFTSATKGVPDKSLRTTWTIFQNLFRKWNRRVAMSIIDCIQTKEFMHVYNAIVVLKEILDVFPLASVGEAGVGIHAAVERLVETETRGDLKILARSYLASLKKKEADWLPVKLAPHLNGTTSARPSPQVANTPLPDKPRNPSTPTPTGPSAQSLSSSESRRTGPQPPPSAPRAANANTATHSNDSLGNSITSTKLAMESIPRPEVVKRVRPDPKASDSPRPPPDASIPARPDISQSLERRGTPTEPRYADNSRHPTREPPHAPLHNGSLPRDHHESSRHHRANDLPPTRQEIPPAMPPPAAPSQTASAQELRETARQSISRPERLETTGQNGSGAPSPRVRSPSPSSRPGTRNGSTDSRTSGDKSRSDAGNAERSVDDRRPERDTRLENREPTSSLSRRDSLTHNRSERRDRGGRDADKDRDSERDKDRGRERHGDRERERDRDRERERDRDKDRETRGRRRGGRDEEDRDRDSRKDREPTASRNQPAPPVAPADERGLPSRPDNSRRRDTPQSNGDDSLGKRRRPPDDEPPERESKRSARKDGRRDDRGRRAPEKDREDRGRDSDRRRKDRDGQDESRASPADKSSDKRLHDAPSGPSGSKTLPATPTGPRAGVAQSSSKPEPINVPTRDRGDRRDAQGGKPTPSGPSLQSRISEKDISASHRGRDRGHEEDRDHHKKRTASDRDMDVDPGPSHEPSVRPKRARAGGRGGSGSSAFAKRVLQIDQDHRGPRK